VRAAGVDALSGGLIRVRRYDGHRHRSVDPLGDHLQAVAVQEYG
jgi:hypothetical protein